MSKLILSILLGLIITVGLISCKKKQLDDIDKTFSISEIKIEQLLGIPMDIDSFLWTPTDIFFNDSLLFVSNSGGLDLNVDVYSFIGRKGKKIGSIIPTGAGPNEMLSVAGMIFQEKHSFWAFDVVSAQFKNFQLIRKKDTVYAESTNSTIYFKVPIFNAEMIGTKIVTTTQLMTPLNRFFTYDFEGNLEAKGTYPTYQTKVDLPNSAIPDIFLACMSAKPNGEKFVLAYKYTDLIEIYNDSLEYTLRIQGPHIFLPDFDLMPRGNHLFMRPNYKKTRLGYRDVVAGPNGFMLLYGNGSLRKTGIEGLHYKHILFMDWEGNLLKYYELDEGIIQLTVDWKNQLLYGLQRIEEPAIIYKFAF